MRGSPPPHLQSSRHERRARAPKRIAVLTDGRIGNENQALGLAEALARRLAAEGASPPTITTARAALRPWAAWAPPSAMDAAARALGDGVLLAAIGGGDADFGAGAAPDLVIGTGRRSAPIVAALRRRGAVAAQLLNPQMRLDAFDLVVAPAHDRLTGPNTHASIGSMNRIDPVALAAAPSDPRIEALARPRVAILIGGASKSASFEAADVTRLASAIAAFGQNGWACMATASRRTPPQAREALAAAVVAEGGFFWDGAGDNPFFSMLAAADAIVATADSVNMASEAAATGKPLFIAPLSGLSKKLTRFHEALAQGGHARPLDAPASIDLTWRPTPLRDMDDAVDRVLALF